MTVAILAEQNKKFFFFNWYFKYVIFLSSLSLNKQCTIYKNIKYKNNFNKCLFFGLSAHL